MTDHTANRNARRSGGVLAGFAETFDPLRSALDTYAKPLVLLLARLWMAKIFFDAGWSRIVNWGSQDFLFSNIHPVPFLPASLAAPVTTAGELGLSVLLAFGLLGRLSATGLLVMTMVIQWVVGQTPEGIENGIANPSHYYWMLIFGLLIVCGPGRISLDELLSRGSGRR